MARKKKESNTGFRNGKLFCFNCGESYDMFAGTDGQGVAIGLSADIMIGFAKQHLNCKPTWTEPVNEDAANKSEIDNALWWAQYGERGSSSECIFNHLNKSMRYPKAYDSHPLDPSDFNRCYKLLKAVPQWRERITEMRKVSPVWERLVDNWDKLESMLEEQLETKKPNGMYEFMNQLIESAKTKKDEKV